MKTSGLPSRPVFRYLSMRKENTPPTFQDLIRDLSGYWAEQGCAVVQPFDLPMGAATFHPASFLRAIGPASWRAVYVQGCRRPGDGRYGENPLRLQHYYQLQVILKPPPENIQGLYLKSLEMLGIDPLRHDVRFVEDNWESPTLGAWGLGWEVWIDGMEVSQFTYFQQIGGLKCQPVSGEITYGLERLAMYLQDSDSTYDLVWCHGDSPITYGELFRHNEAECSAFNFEHADTGTLTRHFDDHEKEGKHLVKKQLVLPAYEQVILASHVFNLLDARHAISVTERQRCILRIRELAKLVAVLELEKHTAGNASDD